MFIEGAPTSLLFLLLAALMHHRRGRLLGVKVLAHVLAALVAAQAGEGREGAASVDDDCLADWRSANIEEGEVCAIPCHREKRREEERREKECNV